MMQPLVSVKMITYNQLLFIGKAIEGVLKQKTNFPFELLIGEDCSTDGTRDIVHEYKKKYPDMIRVITSDKNVGMKKNGLRTLKAARGKYVAYCEGDHYWHNPMKLQKQAEYLEMNPECGMVYSSYDVYHVKSKKRIEDFINYRKWEMPQDWTVSEYLESSGGRSVGVITCTVMARRDLCEQIIEADPYLHQSDHFLMGDTQLWAEMTTLAKIHYIPESLATHNITEESATRSKDVTKRLRFSISNAEMHLYLCDKYNISKSVRERFESYWASSALRIAFHTRNTKLAVEARQKIAKLGWKQWIQYYGAKNAVMNRVCHFAAFFRDSLSKEDNGWS